MEIDERDSYIRNLIQEWVNRKGHDRCFYSNDVLNKIAESYGIEKEPVLPEISEDEFRIGCEVYRAMIFKRQIPSGYEDIASKIKL